MPASWNSRYRSFPSRVRSPTPQNTDLPPCPLATLLMSSWMTTVFPPPAAPTGARPPRLPPRAAAAERRLAAVPLGDVVDELLDDDRLPHAGAAEEPDLPALDERGDQVDDLDPRLEHLGLRLERDELRAAAVDGPPERVRGDVGAVVHRHAEHVEDAAERRGA